MTMTQAEQDKVTSTAMGLMAAMVKPGGVEKMVESLKDREQISLMRDLVSAGSPGLMEVCAPVTPPDPPPANCFFVCSYVHYMKK